MPSMTLSATKHAPPPLTVAAHATESLVTSIGVEPFSRIVSFVSTGAPALTPLLGEQPPLMTKRPRRHSAFGTARVSKRFIRSSFTLWCRRGEVATPPPGQHRNSEVAACEIWFSPRLVGTHL